MRRIRFGWVFVAAAAFVTTACEPTAPEEVTSVVVVSGDNQTVSVNGVLPDPVEVEIRTAAGKPRPYAPLYWTIGRVSGTEIVPDGRIIQAFASADRHGRATGEFQVGEAGTYQIEAVAKIYRDENGNDVKVSAVATVNVVGAGE